HLCWVKCLYFDKVFCDWSIQNSNYPSPNGIVLKIPQISQDFISFQDCKSCWFYRFMRKNQLKTDKCKLD
ncbi:unnamed protein product, partial [Tenebrio molitor]